MAAAMRSQNSNSFNPFKLFLKFFPEVGRITRLGYFGIASIKTTMQEWDGWLRRRYRCYIWKQWKKPRKRAKSLIQLGIPEWQAWAVSNCRKAYWHMAKNGHVQRAISTEKLAQRGYKSILELHERALMRLNRRIPNGTYGGVRGRLGI